MAYFFGRKGDLFPLSLKVLVKCRHRFRFLDGAPLPLLEGWRVPTAPEKEQFPFLLKPPNSVEWIRYDGNLPFLCFPKVLTGGHFVCPFWVHVQHRPSADMAFTWGLL